MKRHKHSLTNYKLLTLDMGMLVPINLLEVLPGDAFEVSSSALVRVSPLLAPVMHPVTVRIHHWFVPHRLVWSGWEDFITGGPDGTGGSAGAYPAAPYGPVAAGSVLDYMGVPVGSLQTVCTMPLSSYNLIFNEFYRDEDLVPEASLTGNTLQRIAWEKDYFTSSRPWPQKGPEVTMPLGTQAPIHIPGGASGDDIGVWNDAAAGLRAMATSGTALESTNTVPTPTNNAMYANLQAATAVGVNDVRRAFAIQRYQEARARYGSRYTEYLRYLGVHPSDARLQRPEYIGGGKQTITFSEVIQTGAESAAVENGVGTLKGHGIAAMRSRRARKFFNEHGYMLSLMSVRPRSMYTDGRHRLWDRRTKEDYWQKELEMIGQQEVYNREVWVDGTAADDDVFGYQDRYSEYKHHPSTIAGEFRDILNYWHLGRQFAARPVLNQSFTDCNPGKRIHAEQTKNQLWVMVNNQVRARRMVTRSSASRIY